MVDHRTGFHESVERVLREELSATVVEFDSSPRYVKSDEAIHDHSTRAQFDGIRTLTGAIDDEGNGERRLRRKVRLRLASDEREAFGLEEGAETHVLTQDEMEVALASSLGKPALIERSLTAYDPWRPQLPGEDCIAAEPRDSEEGGDDTDEDTSEELPADVAGVGVEFDSEAAMARLLSTLRPPGNDTPGTHHRVGLEQRLTPEEIPKALGGC